jgi:hypothetical protein
MEGVVKAAGEAGLPAEYVRSLYPWLPSAPQHMPEPVQVPKVRPRWSAPSGLPGKLRGA